MFTIDVSFVNYFIIIYNTQFNLHNCENILEIIDTFLDYFYLNCCVPDSYVTGFSVWNFTFRIFTVREIILRPDYSDPNNIAFRDI